MRVAAAGTQRRSTLPDSAPIPILLPEHAADAPRAHEGLLSNTALLVACLGGLPHIQRGSIKSLVMFRTFFECRGR